MVETTPLTSSRLTLSPLDPSDAAEMVDVLGHIELYGFMGGTPPDLDRLEAQYRAQVAGPSRDGETWHNWIVRLEGSAVGFVQATVIGNTADIAWVVGVPWQRQGFASEAAIRMCQSLTEQGVEHFEAHIHPDHLASQKVAAAVGLTESSVIDEDGEVVWTSLRSMSNPG